MVQISWTDSLSGISGWPDIRQTKPDIRPDIREGRISGATLIPSPELNVDSLNRKNDMDEPVRFDEEGENDGGMSFRLKHHKVKK